MLSHNRRPDLARWLASGLLLVASWLSGPVFAAPPDVVGPIGTVSVNEDAGPVTIDLDNVFKDPEGLPLIFAIDSNDNAALVSASLSGSQLTLAFAPNQSGTAKITVSATDVDLPPNTVTDTFVVDVAGVNDVPTVAAPPAPVTVAEDSGAASASLAGVFADGDGDALTLSVSGNSNAGLFAAPPTLLGTTLQFTPAPNANGVATLTIQADDGNGGSVTTTQTVTVTPVNDAPTVAAAPAAISVAEDSGAKSASMAGVFTDADANPLTLTVTGSTNPALFAAGPVMSGTQLQFTPAPNANGAATATIQADDGNGGTVSATVAITVTPVNDAPTVAAAPTPVTVVEDSGAASASLAGVFTDIDGDALTLSVSGNSNPGLFAAPPTVVGTTLQFTPAPNRNGVATLTIRANDGNGGIRLTSQSITVTPVNDAPTVTAPLADVTVAEDSAATTISIAGVFGDVDIATGDSLTFTLVSNSNPALATAALSGTTLTLTPLADQNGSATIVVRATDSSGATVTDDLVLNVTQVNDVPVAQDDSATMAEDAAGIAIAVLANDSLAEQPTTITRAGATVTIAGQAFPNSSESPPTTVNDPGGNPVTLPNGTVTIQGNAIFYEPKPDFQGTDTFTYQITDSDGDSATATVTVTVTAVNDPPIGIQERTYSIIENTTLTLAAGQGVLQGAYDVDNKLVDASGNEVGGQTLTSVINSLPINGTLTLNPATGAFTYTPLLNFVGEDQFTYRISDGSSLSAAPAYVVRVLVIAQPPPPPPPAPGAVAYNYNLSNTPLEQIAGVPSNVLVIMDDSGSMDFNAVIQNSIDGVFSISNAPVATKSVRENSFTYLFDLKSNVYPPSSGFGRILPTQAALDADANMTGNNYGVWRGRSSKYNTIYYNPEIRYEPWIGQDISNANFANSVPTAARLNPLDPTRVMNLTVPVNFTAKEVPRWRAAGGTDDISVTNFYIPSYWATTASPPLAWNAPFTRIEIKAGRRPARRRALSRRDATHRLRRGRRQSTTCTYAQELQNFANWFAYYRSREYVTKNGIGSTVAAVQDIRVGYDTVSNTTSVDIRADERIAHQRATKERCSTTSTKWHSFGGIAAASGSRPRRQDVRVLRPAATVPHCPRPKACAKATTRSSFQDGLLDRRCR